MKASERVDFEDVFERRVTHRREFWVRSRESGEGWVYVRPDFALDAGLSGFLRSARRERIESERVFVVAVGEVRGEVSRERNWFAI